MCNLGCPCLEFCRNVNGAVDVIHEIEPDHLHTESLFAHELSPESFKIVAVIINVISENEVTVPGHRRTMFLECIGISESSERENRVQHRLALRREEVQPRSRWQNHTLDYLDQDRSRVHRESKERVQRPW